VEGAMIPRRLTYMANRTNNHRIRWRIGFGFRRGYSVITAGGGPSIVSRSHRITWPNGFGFRLGYSVIT
jgi:hypothetical protein